MSAQLAHVAAFAGVYVLRVKVAQCIYNLM